MTKQNSPLVSTIISVYNGENYLSEAIQSVINQEYPHIDIIIIDDGSTDGSRGVAEQFGPPVQYYYQDNTGIAAAKNHGIELSKGDFLAFLDADDLWIKNKIKQQMDAFTIDSTLDIVFSHVKQFHSPELSIEEKQKIWCPDELMPGYHIGTMLIKRKSFFKVGMFDTQWRRGIFVNWYMRALEIGLRKHMLPDMHMWRRLHRTNHGIVNHDKSVDYIRMFKASLDRRRSQTSDSI